MRLCGLRVEPGNEAVHAIFVYSVPQLTVQSTVAYLGCAVPNTSSGQQAAVLVELAVPHLP